MSRLSILPVAASLLLCGCAIHRVAVADPNPSGAWQSVHSTAFAFGAVTRRTIVNCRPICSTKSGSARASAKRWPPC